VAQMFGESTETVARRLVSGVLEGFFVACSSHSSHGRGWFRTSDLSRVKRALSH
jgi:hypothetical protein